MYLPAAEATKQKKSKKVLLVRTIQVQLRVVVHFCYRRSKVQVYRGRHEFKIETRKQQRTCCL